MQFKSADIPHHRPLPCAAYNEFPECAPPSSLPEAQPSPIKPRIATSEPSISRKINILVGMISARNLIKERLSISTIVLKGIVERSIIAFWIGAMDRLQQQFHQGIHGAVCG